MPRPTGFPSLLPRLAACLLAGLCTLPTCAAERQAGPRQAGPRQAGHAANAVKSAKPAQPPILIGDINSYKLRPDLLDPYRKGWQMALDEINRHGGVLGRKLRVISSDDGGTAHGAVAAAQKLADRDHVTLFFGGFNSDAGLALSDYAGINQDFYLATFPMSSRLTWQQGNAYTYQLAPSGWMQMAALVPRAFGLRKRRWAVVYSDDAYGRPTVATFTDMITHFQSHTTIVSNQAAEPGKFEASKIVRQLLQDKPDALFILLDGPDLVRFVHDGKAQGLLQNMPVVAPTAGEPETLQALGTDAQAGWLVSGYPCVPIGDQANMQRFNQDYQARYGTAPGSASALGYMALRAIAAGLLKASDDDPHAVAAAFAGLKLDTPYGPVRFRPIDHQSTLGVCLAVTAEQDGRMIAQPTGYLDGSRLQPPDKAVRALRGKQQ
ncbi:ABC transporter substrate-binding protein [Bordetella sp. FB-8]|uniref:ABC transporter substrate-binding protein n=1 Tax=Bordetella sp. FB-8 TaxID=1159870 RepID=UPI000382DEDB|nr:ABC transporter substrate-binding protein [Bordetella sp. FB-8]